MSQISNLIPSDRRRLNRVWAFAQNNKGPADHSKVQIEEGKAQTKKTSLSSSFSVAYLHSNFRINSSPSAVICMDYFVNR